MINTVIKGINLTFETSENVFSPSDIDKGTLSMLSEVDFAKGDKVLDLGCGYGVVGILAGKIAGNENVIMCDNSDEAIRLSKINSINNNSGDIRIIKSDGLNDIKENNFTLILSNPPYHADFSVPKNFIEKGFEKLAAGGRMVMVTKRRDWYKNKLISVFGGVKIKETNGYYIFIAEKRSAGKPAKQKQEKKHQLSKKLRRKYR